MKSNWAAPLGDERWKHLRVELLDLERLERGVQGATELRHELSHLRPGTRYRDLEKTWLFFVVSLNMF